MKAVLLHDWLTDYRGGERVLEVFCEMFPDAPLYTLLYKKGSVGPLIEGRKIVASWLNTIPRIHTHYRKFLPLFPFAASRLKIMEKADIVLSSSHCVIKGVPCPSGAKHICYIHSPMRYLYDQYDHYFGSDAPLYQRWGMKIFKGYLIRRDLADNDNVDVMLANSRFVQKRITTWYRRSSEVVHPFVELADVKNFQKESIRKESFYVLVSAFAPNKRIDVAVKAFNENGRPLKIIGTGQQEKMLKNLARSNIEFLGRLPRQELLYHLSRARALIFPGVEDFGITPLEALSVGTPVIAQKKGGVLDTLDESVAEFFEEKKGQAMEDSLVEAIIRFERRFFDRMALFSRADKFSRESFKKKMMGIVERVMQ